MTSMYSIYCNIYCNTRFAVDVAVGLRDGVGLPGLDSTLDVRCHGPGTGRQLAA